MHAIYVYGGKKRLNIETVKSASVQKRMYILQVVV